MGIDITGTMHRRRYLSAAAAGVVVSISGCQSVLSQPEYDDTTTLSRILPTDEQLESYTLVSDTEEGLSANDLKTLSREFTPTDAADEPVASRLTAGAQVARDVETAKMGMPPPVKDAISGEDNDVAWVSLEGYQVAKWVDRRHRAVFTLRDSNLTLSIAGTFDGDLTAARWEHIRPYVRGTLRRLDATA